jgi:guanylate kinase
LVEALRRRRASLRYSVSATTREPRADERNGEHYYFVAQEEFQRLHLAGLLLESREYNGNLYGTPRDYIEQSLTEGYDVIMKPEVNGALAVQSAFPDAVLIFLVPDRFSNLRERLLARRTETNEEIARRLEIATREMKFIRKFDYIVVNEQDRSEQAVRDLEAILQAERFRIHRYPDDSLRRVESS